MTMWERKMLCYPWQKEDLCSSYATLHLSASVCVCCKSFAVSLWHVSHTVCHKAELTIHQSSPVGDMNGRDVWHYLSVARHSGFVAVSALPANWRQSPLQHAALDAVCAGIFCPYSGRAGIIFPRLASMTEKNSNRKN